MPAVNVAFPPFSFLSECVKKEASASNDPSFTKAHIYSVSSRKEKPPGNYNTRPSVTVHKTDVSADVATTVKIAAEDSSRQCTIHHKPHPLTRCRGCIKNNNICYRCLASTSHQAKDCNVMSPLGVWSVEVRGT